MRYVALLRGINVGGANKISMADLKRAFEDAGMRDVRTYINSGNVVFTTDFTSREDLLAHLTRAAGDLSGKPIDVQLRTTEQMRAVTEALPAEWADNSDMKCDVVFLQPEVDRPEVIDELGPRPGIEDAIYVPGAVIWRIDRKDATRNRLTRMTGTPLYARVTVRNCNTVRKLEELLGE